MAYEENMYIKRLFERLSHPPAPIAPVERIELPDGWNAELLELEGRIEVSEEGYLTQSFTEYSNVSGRKLFVDPSSRFKRAYTRQWARVSEQYIPTITHPVADLPFTDDRDAARVLAYYLPRNVEAREGGHLLQAVMGGTADGLHVAPKAYFYAQRFTRPGSQERARVEAANTYLGRDMPGSHG